MLNKYTLLLVFIVKSVCCFAQFDSLSKAPNNEKWKEYFLSQQLMIDTSLSPAFYKTAYDWLGTHYKYSGNSARGIDCSGFAKVLYKATFNDTLIGGSADIAKQVQLIEKEKLQTGDLLFFRIKRKRISHVGVYLGNNKFVHAAVKGGVQINDLNEPYYKRYFYKGGKRTTSKLG
ncbi:MAG TPA: NlpC/P60 family protein [Bacteroidia bacterium]|nr:NlpC/P60 family protein [Bacteroidia bacterium]